MTNALAKNLVKLAKSNESARAIFMWLSSSGQHRETSSVTRIQKMSGVDRRHVVPVLKELEELGVGQFIVGRHTSPSRFNFRFDREEIGKAAFGKIKNLEPRYEDDGEDERLDRAWVERLMKHHRKALAVAMEVDVEHVTITIDPTLISY